MRERYTVSDGKLVLTLEAAEEGGYIVTSPLDPELITEAETVEEAFVNASDAARALKQSRAKGGLSLYDRLKPVIGAAKDWPPDASINVDHYLYGHPKK
jgi:antitoxin HicB